MGLKTFRAYSKFLERILSVFIYLNDVVRQIAY